jgi:hypothetical protein
MADTQAAEATQGAKAGRIHPVMARALAPFAPAGSTVHRAPKLPSFKATLGENIAIEVFYEHTPAEAAIYDMNSPVCGPGHDAEIEICEVMLQGEDVRDLLAPSVIESLEQLAWQRVVA